MDKIGLLNISASIAFFVSLLLTIFLLTVGTKNKLANLLLAIYLILSAISISGFFIYDYVIENFLVLEIFRWTSCLVIIPSFYLYILSVCYTDFRLKLRHLYHLIPFIFLNLFLIPNLYLENKANKIFFFENIREMPELYVSNILFGIQFIVYAFALFFVLKKYRKIYLENYASSNSSTYNWLLQMTFFFLLFYSFVIFKNFLIYTSSNEIFIWTNVALGNVFLFITCWFVLKALNHPEIFRGIDSRLQLTSDIINESLNNNSHATTDRSENAIVTSQIELLKDYMITHEPYLNPSLTIQEIATQINIPVRELSVLINHYINQHFFDFVNEYRIKKAMEILRNNSDNSLTILEILYKVGFNSKSSFNTSFKKYTGVTPTNYRNSSK